MTHSIIIPHRDRHERLEHCLRSIARSSLMTGITEYSALLVDVNSSTVVYEAMRHGPWWDRVEILTLRTGDKGFNKCRALNQGLDKANGSIVTFLDADAIVGPRWLEGVRHLEEDSSLVRLCYRVQKLPEAALRYLSRTDDWDALLASYFRQFNDHQPSLGINLGYEAYYDPATPYTSSWDVLPSPEGPHVFGNSQCSMRREDLKGLRWDEETFPRAGYEDVDFMKQVLVKFGDRYKANILTDADHAMFHIDGTRESDWGGNEEVQKTAYRRKWGLEQRNRGSASQPA